MANSDKDFNFWKVMILMWGVILLAHIPACSAQSYAQHSNIKNANNVRIQRSFIVINGSTEDIDNGTLLTVKDINNPDSEKIVLFIQHREYENSMLNTYLMDEADLVFFCYPNQNVEQKYKNKYALNDAGGKTYFMHWKESNIITIFDDSKHM